MRKWSLKDIDELYGAPCGTDAPIGGIGTAMHYSIGLSGKMDIIESRAVSAALVEVAEAIDPQHSRTLEEIDGWDNRLAETLLSEAYEWLNGCREPTIETVQRYQDMQTKDGEYRIIAREAYCGMSRILCRVIDGLLFEDARDVRGNQPFPYPGPEDWEAYVAECLTPERLQDPLPLIMGTHESKVSWPTD